MYTAHITQDYLEVDGTGRLNVVAVFLPDETGRERGDKPTGRSFSSEATQYNCAADLINQVSCYARALTHASDMRAIVKKDGAPLPCCDDGHQRLQNGAPLDAFDKLLTSRQRSAMDSNMPSRSAREDRDAP